MLSPRRPLNGKPLIINLLARRLPLLLGFFMIVPTALPQSLFLTAKDAYYIQTSSSAPSPGTSIGLPAYFVSIQTPAAATVTPPGLALISVPFSTNNNDYELDGAFATKAALDAAYPNGNYVENASGFAAVTIGLVGDLYPSVVPQVTSGGTWQNNILVVNASQSVTLNLSTFTGYTSTSGGQVAGLEKFQLQSQTSLDNVNINQQIATQAVAGLTQSSTPFTSYTIPAGTLKAGLFYQVQFFFDSIVVLNTTAISGSVIVGYYANVMQLFIAAQAPTPPAVPTITAQPVNVTGSLGSSITFIANYSPSSQQNTSTPTVFIWYFNGQQISSGSKYSYGTNANLTVNNISTSDVGTYLLLILNSSGLVAANPVTLSIGATTGLPVISAQPNSVTINGSGAGTTVAFTVAASNATSYLWKINGLSIIQSGASGVTSPTLLISGANGLSAGSYTCVVSNSAGSVTSSPATLTVVSTTNAGRLTNLSTRAQVGTGANVLIAGFALGGAGTSGTKPMLIRGSGPALTAFGVSGALPDPQLTLLLGSTTVDSNAGWSTNATAAAQITAADTALGAFALTTGSLDSALYESSLGLNTYSAQIAGKSGDSGVALAEVYDATPAASYTLATPRLTNLSARVQVGTGGNVLIAGFAIGGTTAKTVLIRASGPALVPFGVSGTLADPQLQLFNGSGGLLAANTGWAGNAQIAAAAAQVGAFTWTSPTSADSALLVTLMPGTYSAQVAGAIGDTGVALAEVYEVP